MSNVQKFNDLHKTISSHLTDRDKAARLVVASLLTKSHGFFYGPPGTGKSALLLLLGKAFEDARYYQTLMHGQSKAADLFGPPDLESFKRNQLRVNTTNRLPEANIAFLDEIWKCNAQTLNSLLQLVNERLFNNGDSVQRCPLVSLFGASNELPDDTSLEALRDRFVWSYHVEPVQDKESFDTIVMGGPMEMEPFLTLENLAEAQAEVDRIIISREFLDALYEVKVKLGQHFGPNLFISDRRWKAIAQFAKGLAYLDGYSEVPRHIIPQLAPCLWKEVNQIAIIREILYQFGDDIRRIVTPHVTTIRGLFETQREILEPILQNGEVYNASQDKHVARHGLFKAVREGQGKFDTVPMLNAAKDLIQVIQRHDVRPEDQAKVIDLLVKSRNLEASITKLTKAVTVDAYGVIAAINGIEDSLSRF